MAHTRMFRCMHAISPSQHVDSSGRLGVFLYSICVGSASHVYAQPHSTHGQLRMPLRILLILFTCCSTLLRMAMTSIFISMFSVSKYMSTYASLLRVNNR